MALTHSRSRKLPVFRGKTGLFAGLSLLPRVSVGLGGIQHEWLPFDLSWFSGSKSKGSA